MTIVYVCIVCQHWKSVFCVIQVCRVFSVTSQVGSIGVKGFWTFLQQQKRIVSNTISPSRICILKIAGRSDTFVH